MSYRDPREAHSALPAFSKRAALRMIQRAIVLTGRDRKVRQHLRNARLVSVWKLEDWGLIWTLELNRGQIEFDRRPRKHPDLELVWPSAAEFFAQIETESSTGDPLEFNGNTILRRRFLEPVLQTFRTCLRSVLAHPVGENGEPLI